MDKALFNETFKARAALYLQGIDQIEAPEMEDVMTGFAKECLEDILEELQEMIWQDDNTGNMVLSLHDLDEFWEKYQK